MKKMYLLQNMFRMMPSTVKFDYDMSTKIAQKMSSHYDLTIRKSEVFHKEIQGPLYTLSSMQVYW